MGFFDLFKSKKTTTTQEPMLEEYQKLAGSGLGTFIQKYLSQYEPGKESGLDFSSLGTATGAENTGLDQLNKYLASVGTGDLFDASKQQTLDTLGGRYANPNESPFIKSMINLSNMNLQDSIDQSRRSAGSRGTYFTKSAIEGENRLRERANTGLDAVVGDFINQERGRQFAAAPFAQQLDQYANQDVPLSKIHASQTYGSLPRLLQSAQLEAEYNDFSRKQDELSGVPQAAQSLFGTQVPYGIKSLTTKAPSTFMSMLGELSPIVGSYNTHQYGYDKNQSTMSDAMKSIMKILNANGGIMN